MAGSFEGWYFKCRAPSGTLALIPAAHGRGKTKSASLQVLTKEGSWALPFPGEAFRLEKGRIELGCCRFGPRGIRLALEQGGFSLSGELRFGPLSPLGSDIMGPFRFVPFLECRHSVFSMLHRVNGSVRVGREHFSFQNALGYWEGDRGRSFPREYAWTHCFFPGGSLMLSVARIPLGPLYFTGVIGAVLWRGEEYRLASYLGARPLSIQNGALVIRQGEWELEARLLEQSARPLLAPVQGDMARTIREGCACRAFYRFSQRGKPLFSFESAEASFEYEYPN